MITIFYNNLISKIQHLKSKKAASICSNFFAFKTKKYQKYIEGLDKSIKLLKKNYTYFEKSGLLENNNLYVFYFKCKSELLSLSYSFLKDSNKKVFGAINRSLWGSYSAVKHVIKLLDKMFQEFDNE